MSYYTTGIQVIDDQAYHGGRLLRVSTTQTDKTIQCYVSGSLLGWRVPQQGTVEFFLADLRETDIVFLLAVDNADAKTNFWDDAFPIAVAHGNRVRVQTPQLSLAYLPDDVWKVYLGNAGSSSADTLKHKQQFFPGGRRCCGYGLGYSGGYGFDGSNAKGYGFNYGRGEYGFDCEMLQWLSEPLTPGTYPLRVVVESSCGNESTAYETTVELDTFARPATDLAISSYDKDTDQLVLTFTGSLDI